jgi:hypothetical protein
MLHQHGTITVLMANPSPRATAAIRFVQIFGEDIDREMRA